MLLRHANGARWKHSHDIASAYNVAIHGIVPRVILSPRATCHVRRVQNPAPSRGGYPPTQEGATPRLVLFREHFLTLKTSAKREMTYLVIARLWYDEPLESASPQMERPVDAETGELLPLPEKPPDPGWRRARRWT